MYIVGTHDDKTIEQLREVEIRAARVALMGDAHYGYFMPIGGIVAYRDWISPAAVGYDISCFSGDTKVFTLDGKTPTIRELTDCGDEFYVISCNSDGTLIPSKANARLTKKNVSLIQIELDLKDFL